MDARVTWAISGRWRWIARSETRIAARGGVARFVSHLSGSVSEEGDSGTPVSLVGESWRGL